MPEVSIIVPVLNSENYIDRCIDSLVNQTVSDIEILLMVGFCRDDSLEKCLSWQKKDNRIIVVSRNDSSLGDARNYALKIATGNYIAYADADDYYSFDYLEKMCTPLDQDDSIEMTRCGYVQFDGDSERLRNLPDKEGIIELTYEKYLVNILEPAVWMKVFRRKWLIQHNIQMFDGCCEDQALHYMLAALVKKAFLVKEALYHYNVGNENSLVRTLKSMTDYAPATEFAIRYLEKRDLFQYNRNSILNRVVQTYKDFLSMTDYNSELVASCKSFLKKFFPEVLDDYYRRKKADHKIKEKLVLYGAGHDAMMFLERRKPSNLLYIVDKNPLLQGTSIYDFKVKSPEELFGDSENVSVIVSSSKYYYEIVKELMEQNIQSIFTPQDFCECNMKRLFGDNLNKKIVLLNSTVNANIGDHMISEAEKLFFRKYLPDWNVVEVTAEDYDLYSEYLHEYIKEDDIIVITGGGFLGSLWMYRGENCVRKIIQEYSKHKIIIFPQSIFFENTPQGNAELEISKEIYNRCEELILFLREKFSYQRAVSILGSIENCILVPDIVLSLKKDDFKYKEAKNKSGLGVCLKDCKESVYNSRQKDKVVEILQGISGDVFFTSMYVDHNIAVEERHSIISEKMSELSGYELVVTDALHCMISCAIVGTPCVALNNISRKIEGVYEWIRSLPYIEFIYDLNNLENAVKKVMVTIDKEFCFDYEPYERLILEKMGFALSGGLE